MVSKETSISNVSYPLASNRASSSQPAWTAKRCSRLLRPLASRLSLLRRRQEQCHARQAQTKRVSTGSSTTSTATTTTTTTTTRTPEQQEKTCLTTSGAQNIRSSFLFSQSQDQDAATDPDWVPMPKRMKLKRKYSSFVGNRVGGVGGSLTAGLQGRCTFGNVCSGAGADRIRKGRSHRVETVLRAPGEIVVPTPIIARSAKIMLEDVSVQSDDVKQRSGLGVDDGGSEDSPGRQNMESSPRKSKRQRQIGSLRGPLAQQFKTLKLKSSTETYNTVEGLCQALDNLLQSTTLRQPRNCCAGFPVAPDKPHCEKGSRSLLATCARRVPDYIALEEEWRHEEEDSADDTDVLAEVYAELEAYGSCEGQGWSYLRETVRAHGVNLLCKALRDGVFQRLIADCGTLNLVFESFILICSTNEASSEMEMLLNAMDEARLLPDYSSDGTGACVYNFIPMPNSINSSLFEATADSVLPIARSRTVCLNRPNILYEMLSKSMENKGLPVTWLATRSFMDEIWPTMIKSLSNINHNYISAIKLLEISIMRCCGLTSIKTGSCGGNEAKDLTQSCQPIEFVNDDRQYNREEAASRYLEDALSNTVLSLCTVVSSVILASVSKSQGQVETGSPSFLWAMGYVSSEFFYRLSHLQHQNRSGFSSQNHAARITTVTAANIILAAKLPGYLPNLKELLKPTEDHFHRNSITLQGSKYNSDLPDGSNNIIYAIASCCARAAGSGGFEHLRNIINAVLKFTRKLSSLRYSAWYMNKLCLEAAVAFAERSECAAHAAYAHEIERSLGTLESVHSRKPTTRSNQFAADVTPSRPQAISQTPSQQRPSMRGFRWEEGICEWIAATPASIFLSKRPVSMVSKYDESLEGRKRNTEQGAEHARLLPLEEKSSLDETAAKRKLRSSSSLVSLQLFSDDGRRQNATMCNPLISLLPRSGPRLVLASVDVNINRSRNDDKEDKKCEQKIGTITSVELMRNQQHQNVRCMRNEKNGLDTTAVDAAATDKTRRSQNQPHNSIVPSYDTFSCIHINNSNIDDDELNNTKAHPARYLSCTRATDTFTNNNIEFKNSLRVQKHTKTKKRTTLPLPPPLPFRRNRPRRARTSIDYSVQQLLSPSSPLPFPPRGEAKDERQWAVALRTRKREPEPESKHRASCPPCTSPSPSSFSSSSSSPSSSPPSLPFSSSTPPTSSLTNNFDTAASANPTAASTLFKSYPDRAKIDYPRQ